MRGQGVTRLGGILMGSLMMASAQSAPPRSMPCTLELTAQLSVRTAGGLNRSDRLSSSLVGTLNEVPGPNGSCAFEFVQSGDQAKQSQVRLDVDQRPASPAGEGNESFGSNQFWAAGPIRFEAPLRGGDLIPVGSLTVAGQVTFRDRPAGANTQARHQVCVVFPSIPANPGLYPPILRFGGPSLWALKKDSGLIVVQGSADYRDSLAIDGSRYTGRVSATFRVDTGKRPGGSEASKSTPKKK